MKRPEDILNSLPLRKAPEHLDQRVYATLDAAEASSVRAPKAPLLLWPCTALCVLVALTLLRSPEPEPPPREPVHLVLTETNPAFINFISPREPRQSFLLQDLQRISDQPQHGTL